MKKRTEKLNELKNRISLALKEDTLQQGFEIICKKLSQLEKENEQLKKKNEKMKCCENCKNHYWNYGELDCRLKYSCYDTNYDKWELAK